MDKQPKTVLIINDEDMIRDTLEAYLESLGWRVFSAHSGEDALDILAVQAPDAAIVDMRLPGMSGQDLILAARAVHPAMRFLIYTGSLEYHPSEELVAAGLTREQVFVKPVEDMRVLAQAVAELMAIAPVKP